MKSRNKLLHWHIVLPRVIQKRREVDIELVRLIDCIRPVQVLKNLLSSIFAGYNSNR